MLTSIYGSKINPKCVQYINENRNIFKLSFQTASSANPYFVNIMAVGMDVIAGLQWQVATWLTTLRKNYLIVSLCGMSLKRFDACYSFRCINSSPLDTMATKLQAINLNVISSVKFIISYIFLTGVCSSGCDPWEVITDLNTVLASSKRQAIF